MSHRVCGISPSLVIAVLMCVAVALASKAQGQQQQQQAQQRQYHHHHQQPTTVTHGQASPHTTGRWEAHAGYTRLPGVKATITENGLAYIKDVSLPSLITQLEASPIPDQSADGYGFTVTLTDIAIATLTVDTSDVGITSTGFDASMSDVSGGVNLNWGYRQDSWPHVSDSGTASITFSGSTISTSIDMYIAANGVAQMNATESSCSIENVDISLYGGASWFYQIFVDLFEGQITDAINSAIPPVLSQSIQQSGNAALATMPIIQTVTPNVEIDYAFVDQLIFQSGVAFTTSQWGEFYCVSDKVEANYSIAQMPSFAQSNDMMQVFVNEYTAYTAGLAYQLAGNLSVDVTPSMVPSSFPVQLNTSDFKVTIPALYSKYPNMGMVLALNSTLPPAIDISPSGVFIKIFGDVTVYAIQPNASWALAFVLQTQADLNATATITGNNLGGRVSLLNVTFSVVETTIGPISAPLMNSVVNLLLTDFVVPALNNQLQPGFALPSIEGISFVNPSVAYSDGYLWVGTNISLTSGV